MTIEKALEWAYREELPREEPDWLAVAGLEASAIGMADASGPMQRFLANPSQAINAPLNRWGVVGVRLMFERGPHPDALLIGRAVETLCSEAVTLAGPAPEPDGDTFGAEALWADAYARASARLPRCLRDVIIRRALAGDMQQWEEEAVSRVAITHENGRPRWYRLVEREAVTRDGRKTGEVERAEMIVDVRREPGRRPGKDCYQKYRLEPDPIWMIEARAVYTAWRAALDLLHAELEGQTTRVILMPAQSPWEPWQQPEAA
ncbi:MAG: hypothetical protein LCH39_01815 [Proteobacteria bacterium]|nr:hypothetical protein [Pseudomonadota bacterium]